MNSALLDQINNGKRLKKVPDGAKNDRSQERGSEILICQVSSKKNLLPS